MECVSAYTTYGIGGTGSHDSMRRQKESEEVSMKKKLAKVTAIALSAAMGLSLTACGGSQGKADSKTGTTAQTESKAGSDSASTEPVELRMSWWGGDERHTATEEAIKKFMEKYPNIKVTAEYGAWTGWGRKTVSWNFKRRMCRCHSDRLQLGKGLQQGWRNLFGLKPVY